MTGDPKTVMEKLPYRKNKKGRKTLKILASGSETPWKVSVKLTQYYLKIISGSEEIINNLLSFKN